MRQGNASGNLVQFGISKNTGALVMVKKQMGNNVAWKALVVSSLAGILMIGGCNSNPRYADSKDAVNNALTQNNLGSIHVAQDRDKGVMTLTGTVPTDDQKTQAESVAKQAAPTYTVADEIAVVPPQNASETKSALSHTDDAIEDNFKAELKKHHNLNDQDISVKSKNGSVTLSGSVKTQAQKREAEKLAKAVPNVQQVVNEIEVKSGKHSTSR
jgi:hyperosmotically inducible periplasmic protein